MSDPNLILKDTGSVVGQANTGSCALNDKKNLNSIGVRDGVGGQGQYRVGRGSIG